MDKELRCEQCDSYNHNNNENNNNKSRQQITLDNLNWGIENRTISIVAHCSGARLYTLMQIEYAHVCVCVHLHSQRFFDMLTVDFSDNLTGLNVKSVSKITLKCRRTTLKEFYCRPPFSLLVVVVVVVSQHWPSRAVNCNCARVCVCKYMYMCVSQS